MVRLLLLLLLQPRWPSRAPRGPRSLPFHQIRASDTSPGCMIASLAPMPPHTCHGQTARRQSPWPLP
jgi:hypothetical protein